MLNPKVLKALNEQVAMEGMASQAYLAMACWCENEGMSGCASFFYQHAEEERMHMLKLVKFINDSDGKVEIAALNRPESEFDNIQQLIESAYENELSVSKSIDELVDVAEKANDRQTANFLQWYVDEQHEEEALYRGLLDKVKLIGIEGRGRYFIDKEVELMAAQHGEGEEE